jgi:hypothetical protein
MFHVPREPTNGFVLGDAQVKTQAVTDQRILWVWAGRKPLDCPNCFFDLQICKFVDRHEPCARRLNVSPASRALTLQPAGIAPSEVPTARVAGHRPTNVVHKVLSIAIFFVVDYEALRSAPRI